MLRNPLSYLWDIRTAIDATLTFVRDLDENAYRANPLVRSAVERQLEIVGEALNQLSKVDAATAAQIPGRRAVIGLRNLLIHGYATVDDGVIWRTITSDLPVLRERVAMLFEGEASDGGRPDSDQST